VFDRVTADMTTTAEHCIAAIGLNAYRQKGSCHDLIIPSLPERLYEYQLSGSCCVKSIAVQCIAPHGGTSHFYCTLSYNNNWLWLSGSNVMSCVSM